MSVVFYCYLSILLKLSTWYCGILWMVAKSTKGWLKHNEMFTTYQLQSFTAVKVTGPASAWQLGTFKSPGAVDGGVAWYGCVWWDIPLVMAIWIGKIMIQWTWGYPSFRLWSLPDIVFQIKIRDTQNLKKKDFGGGLADDNLLAWLQFFFCHIEVHVATGSCRKSEIDVDCGFYVQL